MRGTFEVFVDTIVICTITSFAILTFCLTTQIGFFIYYETAAINVFGKGSMKVLNWLYLLPGVIFAGVANVDRLWIFANISVGVCAIPNLIAILALSGVFFKLMRDYITNRNAYMPPQSSTNLRSISGRQKMYRRLPMKILIINPNSSSEMTEKIQVIII